MNYQDSNPESLSKTPERLSETPERLSETKTRSGSPAAAAKKRAAEVNFLHKHDCGETVQFAWASPGRDVIPRGGDRFTHYRTLYQSLPELRSSERVILEPWPRQTVLQVPMMKENAGRRAFTL